MRWQMVGGVALVLASVVARPARAHEHMYIGSNSPKKGTLVLMYDFTRDFPLVPAPDGNGFIGTDPAFNAQIVADPANGIYPLKNHTVVKWVITAMDPGVSVDFNGIEMTKPGAKATIGRMPYLHQHPDWLLNVAPGVTGEFHLSFRVMAAGYRASAVYTGTLTNVTVPTTTTTTLPGQTCAPGACEDLDPCTIDSCVGGACQHDPETGIGAVQCRLVPLTNALYEIPAPSSAAGRRVVQRMFKTIGVVGNALSEFVAGERDATRKIRKAEQLTNQFGRMVDQSSRLNVMGPAQANDLRTLAGNVYDQLVLLAP
jgi:hypothetical protein